MLHLVQSLAYQIVEVQILPLAVGALVQTGQLQDILHQTDEPLGLGVDIPGEARHIFGADHTGFHQLRVAGDGMQGRFQLVGDIGGEFPALGLRPAFFRHVQQQQHDAGDAAAVFDGVGLHLVLAAQHGEIGLRPVARQGLIHHRFQHILLGDGVDADAHEGPGQTDDPGGGGVHGQHHAPVVDQHQTLVHAVGDGIEFPLFALELLLLALELALLGIDAAQEGIQFLITGVGHGIVQVQLVQRPDDGSGQPGSHPHGQHNGQHDDDQNGLHHIHHQGHGGILGHGQSQHAAIGKPLGGIDELLRQSVGIADGIAGAADQRLADLLTLQMVFHGLGVGVAFVEDAAVGADEGDAGVQI